METDAEIPETISVKKKEEEDKELRSDCLNTTVKEIPLAGMHKIEPWHDLTPETIKVSEKSADMQVATKTEVESVNAVIEGNVEAIEGDNFSGSPLAIKVVQEETSRSAEDYYAAEKPTHAEKEVPEMKNEIIRDDKFENQHVENKETSLEEYKRNADEELRSSEKDETATVTEEKTGSGSDEDALLNMLQTSSGQNAGALVQTPELMENDKVDSEKLNETCDKVESIDNAFSIKTTSIQEKTRETSLQGGEEMEPGELSHSMGKEMDLEESKNIENKKNEGDEMPPEATKNVCISTETPRTDNQTEEEAAGNCTGPSDETGSPLITTTIDETSLENAGLDVGGKLEDNSSIAVERSQEAVENSEKVGSMTSIQDHIQEVPEILQVPEAGPEDILKERQNEVKNQIEILENTVIADSSLSRTYEDHGNPEPEVDGSFMKHAESSHRGEELAPEEASGVEFGGEGPSVIAADNIEAAEHTKSEMPELREHPEHSFLPENKLDMASEKIESTTSDEHATTNTRVEEQRQIESVEDILDETRKGAAIYADEINKKEIPEEKILSTIYTSENTESEEVEITNKNTNELPVTNPQIEVTEQMVGEELVKVPPSVLDEPIHEANVIPIEENRHVNEACEASNRLENSSLDQTTTEGKLEGELTSGVRVMEADGLEKVPEMDPEEKLHDKDAANNTKEEMQQVKAIDTELQRVTAEGDDEKSKTNDDVPVKGSNLICSEEGEDQLNFQENEIGQNSSEATTSELNDGDQSPKVDNETDNKGRDIDKKVYEKCNTADMDEGSEKKIKEEEKTVTAHLPESTAEETTTHFQEDKMQTEKHKTEMEEEVGTNNACEGIDKRAASTDLQSQSMVSIEEETTAENSKEDERTEMMPKEEVFETLQKSEEGAHIRLQNKEEDCTAKDNFTESAEEETKLDCSYVEEKQHDTEAREGYETAGASTNTEYQNIEEIAIIDLPSSINEENSKEDGRDVIKTEDQVKNLIMKCQEQNLETSNPTKDEAKPNENCNAQSMAGTSEEEKVAKESNEELVESSSKVLEVSEKEIKEEISEKPESTKEISFKEAKAEDRTQLECFDLTSEEERPVTSETCDTRSDSVDIIAKPAENSNSTENEDVVIPIGEHGADEAREQIECEVQDETHCTLPKSEDQIEVGTSETPSNVILGQNLELLSTVSTETNNIMTTEASESKKEIAERDESLNVIEEAPSVPETTGEKLMEKEQSTDPTYDTNMGSIDTEKDAAIKEVRDAEQELYKGLELNDQKGTSRSDAELPKREQSKEVTDCSEIGTEYEKTLDIELEKDKSEDPADEASESAKASEICTDTEKAITKLEDTITDHEGCLKEGVDIEKAVNELEAGSYSHGIKVSGARSISTSKEEVSAEADRAEENENLKELEGESCTKELHMISGETVNAVKHQELEPLENIETTGSNQDTEIVRANVEEDLNWKPEASETTKTFIEEELEKADEMPLEVSGSIPEEIKEKIEEEKVEEADSYSDKNDAAEIVVTKETSLEGFQQDGESVKTSDTSSETKTQEGIPTTKSSLQGEEIDRMRHAEISQMVYQLPKIEHANLQNSDADEAEETKILDAVSQATASELNDGDQSPKVDNETDNKGRDMDKKVYEKCNTADMDEGSEKKIKEEEQTVTDHSPKSTAEDTTTHLQEDKMQTEKHKTEMEEEVGTNNACEGIDKRAAATDLQNQSMVSIEEETTAENSKEDERTEMMPKEEVYETLQKSEEGADIGLQNKEEDCTAKDNFTESAEEETKLDCSYVEEKQHDTEVKHRELEPLENLETTGSNKDTEMVRANVEDLNSKPEVFEMTKTFIEEELKKADEIPREVSGSVPEEIKEKVEEEKVEEVDGYSDKNDAAEVVVTKETSLEEFQQDGESVNTSDTSSETKTQERIPTTESSLQGEEINRMRLAETSQMVYQLPKIEHANLQNSDADKAEETKILDAVSGSKDQCVKEAHQPGTSVTVGSNDTDEIEEEVIKVPEAIPESGCNNVEAVTEGEVTSNLTLPAEKLDEIDTIKENILHEESCTKELQMIPGGTINEVKDPELEPPKNLETTDSNQDAETVRSKVEDLSWESEESATTKATLEEDLKKASEKPMEVASMVSEDMEEKIKEDKVEEADKTDAPATVEIKTSLEEIQQDVNSVKSDTSPDSETLTTIQTTETNLQGEEIVSMKVEETSHKTGKSLPVGNADTDGVEEFSSMVYDNIEAVTDDEVTSNQTPQTEDLKDETETIKENIVDGESCTMKLPMIYGGTVNEVKDPELDPTENHVNKDTETVGSKIDKDFNLESEASSMTKTYSEEELKQDSEAADVSSSVTVEKIKEEKVEEVDKTAAEATVLGEFQQGEKPVEASDTSPDSETSPTIQTTETSLQGEGTASMKLEQTSGMVYQFPKIEIVSHETGTSQPVTDEIEEGIKNVLEPISKPECDSVEAVSDGEFTSSQTLPAELEDETDTIKQKVIDEESCTKELHMISGGLINEVKDLELERAENIETTDSNEATKTMRSKVEEDLKCESESSTTTKAFSEELNRASETLVEVSSLVPEEMEEKIEEDKVEADKTDSAAAETSLAAIQQDDKSVNASHTSPDAETLATVQTTETSLQGEGIASMKLEQTSGMVYQLPKIEELSHETGTCQPVTDEIEEGIKNVLEPISEPECDNVEAVADGEVTSSQTVPAELEDETDTIKQKIIDEESFAKELHMISGGIINEVQDHELERSENLEATDSNEDRETMRSRVEDLNCKSEASATTKAFSADLNKSSEKLVEVSSLEPEEIEEKSKEEKVEEDKTDAAAPETSLAEIQQDDKSLKASDTIPDSETLATIQATETSLQGEGITSMKLEQTSAMVYQLPKIEEVSHETGTSQPVTDEVEEGMKNVLEPISEPECDKVEAVTDGEVTSSQTLPSELENETDTIKQEIIDEESCAKELHMISGGIINEVKDLELEHADNLETTDSNEDTETMRSKGEEDLNCESEASATTIAFSEELNKASEKLVEFSSLVPEEIEQKNKDDQVEADNTDSAATETSLPEIQQDDNSVKASDTSPDSGTLETIQATETSLQGKEIASLKVEETSQMVYQSPETEETSHGTGKSLAEGNSDTDEIEGQIPAAISGPRYNNIKALADGEVTSNQTHPDERLEGETETIKEKTIDGESCIMELQMITGGTVHEVKDPEPGLRDILEGIYANKDTETAGLKVEEGLNLESEASSIANTFLEGELKKSSGKPVDVSSSVTEEKEENIKEEKVDEADKTDAAATVVTKETSLGESQQGDKSVEASGTSPDSETLATTETSPQGEEIASMKLEETSRMVSQLGKIEQENAKKVSTNLSESEGQYVEETREIGRSLTAGKIDPDEIEEDNKKVPETISEHRDNSTEAGIDGEIASVQTLAQEKLEELEVSSSALLFKEQAHEKLTTKNNETELESMKLEETSGMESQLLTTEHVHADQLSIPVEKSDEDEIKLAQTEMPNSVSDIEIQSYEKIDETGSSLTVERIHEDETEEIKKVPATISEAKNQGVQSVTDDEMAPDQTLPAKNFEEQLQVPSSASPYKEQECETTTTSDKIEGKVEEIKDVPEILLPKYQGVEAVSDSGISPEQTLPARNSEQQLQEPSPIFLFKERDHETITTIEKNENERTKNDHTRVNEELDNSSATGTVEETCLQKEQPRELGVSELELNFIEETEKGSPNEVQKEENTALEEAPGVEPQEYVCEIISADIPSDTEKRDIQCSSQETSKDEEVLNSENPNKEADALPNSPISVKEMKIPKVPLEAVTDELRTEDNQSEEVTEANVAIKNELSGEKIKEESVVANNTHIMTSAEKLVTTSNREDELRVEECSGEKTDEKIEITEKEILNKEVDELEQKNVNENVEEIIVGGDRADKNTRQVSEGDGTALNILLEEAGEKMNAKSAHADLDIKAQGDETKCTDIAQEAKALSEEVASTEVVLGKPHDETIVASDKEIVIRKDEESQNNNLDDLPVPDTAADEIPDIRIGETIEDISEPEPREPAYEIIKTHEENKDTAMANTNNSESVMDDEKPQHTSLELACSGGDVIEGLNLNKQVVYENEESSLPHSEKFRKEMEDKEDERTLDEIQNDLRFEKQKTDEVSIGGGGKDITCEGDRHDEEPVNFLTRGDESKPDKADIHSTATATEGESRYQNDELGLNVLANIKDPIMKISQEDGIVDLAEDNEATTDKQESKKTTFALSDQHIPRESVSNKDTEATISIGNKDVSPVQQDPVAKTFQNAEEADLKAKNAPEAEPEEKEVEFGEDKRMGDQCIEKTEKASIESDQISLSELLQGTTNETSRDAKHLTEERELIADKDELQTEKTELARVEEAKTDDERDEEVGGEEHKKEDSGSDGPVMVEASRDLDVKIVNKKSHNLLSSVGSKVKHSIAKVKKAITGKASQCSYPRTQSHH